MTLNLSRCTCGEITFSVLFIKQQQVSNFSTVHFHDNLLQAWHPISSITCMFNKEQGDCYSATHHSFYFVLSEVILEILDSFRSLLIRFRNFRFIRFWFSFRTFLNKPLDPFSQSFHYSIIDKCVLMDCWNKKHYWLFAISNFKRLNILCVVLTIIFGEWCWAVLKTCQLMAF